MIMNACAERALSPQNPPPSGANRAAANATLEFGGFRLQLRQRQDGVPIELGTRAFELLLALLKADGSLATKDELMSRVWPGIVVAEENLKVQISALRKALGQTATSSALSSAAVIGSLPQFARETGAGQRNGWPLNGSAADRGSVGASELMLIIGLSRLTGKLSDPFEIDCLSHGTGESRDDDPFYSRNQFLYPSRSTAPTLP